MMAKMKVVGRVSDPSTVISPFQGSLFLDADHSGLRVYPCPGLCTCAPLGLDAQWGRGGVGS